MYSKRIKNISESPTAKIFSKALQMKREKIDIVDLTVGEPDFPTPTNIKEAAKHAIENNLTKYTLNNGTIELRQAIVQKLEKDNNLSYNIENIIVSNGAKQSILNIIMILIGKGDEVIIPAPYWVSYPEIVTIADGKSVIIPTQETNCFKLSPHQLEASISSKTRILILCNPSNPTGSVYSMEELEALAEVVESKNIYIITDEVYEKLVYDDIHFGSFASISPAIKKKTIVINGVSKAYAMTGWRIGYAAGEAEIISAATKFQGHCTSSASSISQYASLEALSGPQTEILKMRAEFEERRDFVYQKLSLMEGISCQKPNGAFYVFPNISAFFNREYNGVRINNSYDMADYLLKEAKVVLMPGAAFGSDAHLRISYTTSMDNLMEGMKRINAALKKL